MKKKFILPLLLFSAILAGVALTSFQRDNSKAKESLTAPVEKKMAPQIALTDIEQTYFCQGEKKWAIGAASAHLSQDGRTSNWLDIRLTSFENRATPVLMTADRGTWHKKTDEVNISGNVTICDEEYKIQTSSLHYQQKKGIIYTDQKVNIDGQALRLQGDSLRYHLKSKKAVLTGNVSGVF